MTGFNYMTLSALQKFILCESYGQRGKILVAKFLKFYQSQSKVPTKHEQVKIVDKSVNRLINKGLLVGWGEKTQHKWFIKEVQLTPPGRKSAKKLQGEQTKLPFKK